VKNVKAVDEKNTKIVFVALIPQFVHILFALLNIFPVTHKVVMF